MIDREKYIEVLSKTVKAVKELNRDAPIKISLECVEDILELLKEQEPKSVLSNHVRRYARKGFCPKCHQEIEWLFNRQYCGFCGQAVKWE